MIIKLDIPYKVEDDEEEGFPYDFMQKERMVGEGYQLTPQQWDLLSTYMSEGH